MSAPLDHASFSFLTVGVAVLAAVGLGLFPLATPPASATCDDPSTVFFTPAPLYTLGSSFGLASGDFNGDGITDLAMAVIGQGVSVQLGTGFGGVGNGGFGPAVVYATGPGPFGVAVGDFNHDGILDLAVANVEGDDVSILLGRGAGGVGDGTFGLAVNYAAGHQPISIATRDANADGITDLAVTDLGGSQIALLLGRGANGVGDGTFSGFLSYPAGNGPTGLVVGDFDGNGVADLAVTNYDAGMVSVLIGRGAGGAGGALFAAPASYPVGSAPVSVAEADVNGDGILDLVVSNSGESFVSVLTGRGSGGVGNGTFNSAVGFAAGSNPRGIAIADFNGDGALDLVVADQGASQISFLPGQVLNGMPTGSFGPPTGYASATNPTGVQLGDFSRDGLPDVAVVGAGGNLAIHLSQCAPRPPVITSLVPAGGAVGDIVTIMGRNLLGTSDVSFSGVSAPVLQVASAQVSTSVPAGATTGPVTVTTPLGTATSPTSFFVGEAPVVSSAAPDHGKVAAAVRLSGAHFNGTIRVRFGPLSNAAFTVDSDQQITATVDRPATTGSISVTNLAGTGISAFTFTVDPPDSAPTITAVRDVPNDQGGKVAVTWLRSDLDTQDLHLITAYRVWRRSPRASEAALVAQTQPGASDRFEARRVVRQDGTTDIDYWEALATLPSAFLEGYSYTAATTQDSLPGSNPFTSFFVQALTQDPFVFFRSAEDSGYSVDNMAPAVPQPVAAVYGPSGVAIHWGANRESDVRGYRIYRGSGPSFAANAGSLLAAVADTGYFDATGSLAYYYKLSALDVHGNESRRVLISPNGPTSAIASLVSADVKPDRVRLVWYAPDDPALVATLYRRTPSTDWEVLATLTADGSGRVSYEDHAVEPGTRYGYRLGIQDAGAEVFAGEVWADVPRWALALRSAGGNPALSGRLEVELTLPAAGEARIALLDLMGRRIEVSEVGSLGVGTHRVELSAGRSLPPGVYLVRLDQNGGSVIRTAVVLR